MDVDLDLHISLFDFLISGVLIWGIYKGYLQGVLVQAIALFALLAGVFISAKLSVSFYNVIIDKSTVALPNLPVIIFAIFFGFVVFFSNFIALRVQNEVTPVPKGLYSRGLGAFFGALKYAFIISIFLIFINKLDQNFDIISVKEKQRTKLFNPFLKLAPTAIPRLNFEIREPEL
ncbi:MAG: CvpA family protein, partial [Bacteroidales bacterium]|nr:CvpA family protein [Bacteroidales bacterium]